MILVTGANGSVGRQVCAALSARGMAYRAATRQTGFDFHDPDGWAAALDGVSSVFLLRPPAIADIDATLGPFIAQARASGIGHIVFLSVAGAERLSFLPHAAVERVLQSGPTDWTIFRPGFFAQNLETAYLADIQKHDRVFVPAGRGRVAFVDVRDIGALAAQILATPADHLGQGYTLTGSQAARFDDVAKALSQATGRRIRYDRASIIGYLRHLRRTGQPWGQALVQTALHVGLRFGQAERVDPTLGRLLGRPARDIFGYIADHAGLFARQS